MRYCDIMETHLLTISFCDQRGGFFACSGSESESLERRRKQPSHSLARSLICNYMHGDREVAHWEQVGSS